MKIVKQYSSGHLGIECAFCGGSGQFPETPFDEDNFGSMTCDVCNGKGFNLILANEEHITPCKSCDEEGQAFDESGHFVGDHCSVCDGKGFLVLSDEMSTSFEDLFWTILNPKIVRISKQRFDAGLYADSVEAAFKEINSIVKAIVVQRTNKELDGAALMERALSLNDPLIVIEELTSETGRNIQKGFMQIFSGAMTGIRNPKAHSNITISKEQTIHYLFLASLLMSKIECLP